MNINIHNQLELFSQKHSLTFEKVVEPFPLGKRENLRVMDKNGKTIILINLIQSASTSVVNKLYILKSSFKFKDKKAKIIIKPKSFLKKVISFFQGDSFTFEVKDSSISPLFFKQIKNELSNYSSLSQLSDFVITIDKGVFSILAKSYYEKFISEALIFTQKMITEYSCDVISDEERKMEDTHSS